jgi:recombination protein RecR
LASSALPRPVARVIDEFARLPGVGNKTASRLAFHLLRADREQARALAAALAGLADGIVTCSRCCNIAEADPCPVCADPAREPSVVCVVEEPLDVLAIERTGTYRGLFHVLHGAISPVDGITPADLRIRELILRLQSEPIREIILATNPSLEGDATAMYIERSVRALPDEGIRITRLARGLPIGGDIEYADEITLARALEGRRDV